MNNRAELNSYTLSQLPLEDFENQPYYSYPYLNIREAFGRQFSRFWTIYRVNQIIYNAKKLKEWKDTVLAVDSALGNSNVQLEGAQVIVTDFYKLANKTPDPRLVVVNYPLNGQIPMNVYHNYILRDEDKIKGTPGKETFVQSALSSVGMFSSSVNNSSHTNQDLDNIRKEAEYQLDMSYFAE